MYKMFIMLKNMVSVISQNFAISFKIMSNGSLYCLVLITT